MVRKFKTIGQFLRALLRRPDDLQRFDVSPGWAVAALGCHRSRIGQLIDHGDLDAVRCDDGIVLLSQAEVLAYRKAMHAVPSRERLRVGRAWRDAKKERSPMSSAHATLGAS